MYGHLFKKWKSIDVFWPLIKIGDVSMCEVYVYVPLSLGTVFGKTILRKLFDVYCRNLRSYALLCFISNVIFKMCFLNIY